jgi:hypothetical protein
MQMKFILKEKLIFIQAFWNIKNLPAYKVPSDIGNIMWIAPRYPCMQPFIPWYYGINKISADYEIAPYTESLQNYDIKNKDLLVIYITVIYGKWWRGVCRITCA